MYYYYSPELDACWSQDEPSDEPGVQELTQAQYERCRDLVKVTRSLPALSDAEFNELAAPQPGWMKRAYERWMA